MPTTRSKTGSLPAKKVVVRKKVKTETTKDDTTSHVPRTTQDLKAKIGDDDKFSVLPMEILTTIFEFCHIYSLAMCEWATTLGTTRADPLLAQWPGPTNRYEHSSRQRCPEASGRQQE